MKFTACFKKQKVQLEIIGIELKNALLI